MDLGEFLGESAKRSSALRQLEPIRLLQGTIRVYASLPLAKTSTVDLKLYGGDGYIPEQHGCIELGDMIDIEVWLESFEDRADPVQAIINYVIDLHDLEES